MSLVGRLEDLSLSDIFQILSVGRKTGTLILKGSSGNALIVFKNGLVVRAETDNLDRTLGEDLLSAGMVKDTIFHLASEVRKNLPTKSIPEILYEFGSLSKDSLEKITKKRVERVVYKLLQWQDGDFQFELDDLNPQGKVNLSDLGWELSKGISPEYLLMEGARVYDESFVSVSEIIGDKKEEGESDEGWEYHHLTERRDISALRALTQELRFPESASEITLLILRFASDIFERGILFTIENRKMVGSGQFGLDIEKPDDKIKEILLPFEDSTFLKKIVMEKRPYKGSMEKDNVTEALMKEIGGGWPYEAVLFPIVTEGKIFALLYCDNLTTGEKMSETEGLEIFIDQAGLAIEKSLLQGKLQEMEKKNKL